MAVLHIAFNDQLQHGRAIRRALSLLEEGHELLNDTIGTLAMMIEGDGSSSDHYAYMKEKCGFPDNATAKAAWEELNSLKFKLNTDSEVTNVHAALQQAFRKFG